MEQGVFSLESPKIPHTIPKGECKLLSVCTPESEYSPEGRTGRAQKRGRTRGHPPAETYVLQTKKPRPQERRGWTPGLPPRTIFTAPTRSVCSPFRAGARRNCCEDVFFVLVPTSGPSLEERSCRTRQLGRVVSSP